MKNKLNKDLHMKNWTPIKGFLDTREKVSELRQSLHEAVKDKFAEYDKARRVQMIPKDKEGEAKR